MSNIDWDSKKVKGQLLLSQIISGISTWIEMLRQYADEIDNCLSDKIKKYESSISSEEDFIEKQQIEMFGELYRSSLFITCYSFYEFELLIICNTFYSRFNLGIKLENYRRNERISLIEKMIDYLNNICMLNMPSNSNNVKNIIIYSKLRNNISHNAGRLWQNIDVIKDFISDNKPKITLNDYDLIILTKEFVFDTITTFDSFFEEFYRAFSSWLDSLEN